MTVFSMASRTKVRYGTFSVVQVLSQVAAPFQVIFSNPQVVSNPLVVELCLYLHF